MFYLLFFICFHFLRSCVKMAGLLYHFKPVTELMA